MHFDHRTFWLPKDIQNRDAYQDAFEVDAEGGIAAIADGVSSSLFAGRWAKTLVAGIVRDTPDIQYDNFQHWLAKHRSNWLQSIDQDSLAWHQKTKLQDGASTTLMWTKLTPNSDAEQPHYELSCYCIGDCCMFHVRNDQVLRAFPFERSELFDLTPEVIRSVIVAGEAPPAFDTLEDVIHAGDLIVLCTDAAAVWALQRLESGKSPNWEAIWNMSPVDWERWVIRLREQNLIRYDDTTIVMLRPTVVATAPNQPPQLMDEVKDQMLDAVEHAKTSVEKGIEALRGFISPNKNKHR
ncbi:MAG: hypothetical protein ACI9HK_004576 [Pirellulaceae bacterium]|jgi:hypothetical protein